MVTTINDDMFTADVIKDPYRYYGRIREEDPVHWNELYELWVITRHDDLVWMTRNHEQFSNAVFMNDPRPAYPAILESDTELYDYVRSYQGDQFIQYDRPEHLEMRKVVHTYFTPKSMEEWRPLVKSAIKDLLDAAEAKGEVDLMRDLAVPLPVLVIAEMMGVPESERGHIRMLAEKLLYVARGEPDRMRILTEGMQGMLDYVDPLVDERIVNPKDDFISVLAGGEKSGVFTRHQVLVNTSLLLLAGHETTINLICNGTLAFMNNRDPNKFENPDTMDITRWPNPHVAFGAGVHHCLGATIARVEGQEVFSALAERYPNLELKTHDMEYQPSITFRSIKSLPVSLN